MVITVDKNEYTALKRDAMLYRKMAQNFFSKKINTLVGDTVRDFKNTNLYTDKFIRDLENGLFKSSLAK